MAIKFNIEPYWDDYNVAGVDGLSPREKYNKILFRPGHALQARELTQLQSMLQNQVSSVGDNLFKEGMLVVPGHVHVHTKIAYIKIAAGTLTLTDYNDLKGLTITDGASSAKIIHAETAVDQDPLTLYVNYISGDNIFASGAALSGTDLNGDAFTLNSITTDAIGYGSLVSVDEGIYYIKKHFVVVSADTIILNKYNFNVSADVGLKITESIVNSGSDISLNDNALGTPNESAPGAHRYSIRTQLSKQDLNASIGNFVLLARIDKGILQPEARIEYNILGDTLARRTFDESGNYTINPFPASIRNEATGDATKLDIAIEPSKAYVRGYEIQTLETVNVTFNKARESALAKNQIAPINFSNYFEVSSMAGFPDIVTFGSINLKENTTTIGTVKVRSIEPAATSGNHILHIFDLKLNSGKTVANVTSIAGGTLTATLVGAATGDDTLLFPLPFSRVKTCDTIVDPDNTLNDVFDYDYSATVVDECTTVGGGLDGVFSVKSVAYETFKEFTTGRTNYIAVVNELGGDILTLQTTVVGDPNYIAFTGTAADRKQITISNLSTTIQGKTIKLFAPVTRTLAHGSKTLTTGSVQFAGVNLTDLNSGSALSLNKCDIIKLTSITEDSTGDDITKHFDLDNGQRSAYYGPGLISLDINTNYTLTGDITVNFDFFTHEAGKDFFTIDSYPAGSYEDIPSFNGVELRSAVDFRPRATDTSTEALVTFDSDGSSICPKESSQFKTDIQYYLNRIDRVYLDKDGKFGVLEGVSELNPELPATPKESMVLYNLFVPAYTLDPSEVNIQVLDNRRYTMRDIGNIESRVDRLEYYTVLSLLEKEAADQQMFDKFKSGFLVDSFQSTNVADVLSPEYSAGIDRKNSLLRPLFSESNVGLTLNESTSTTGVRTGDIVTLPYTNAALLDQQQYSGAVNVNPYEVFNWTGTLKLSPSSDEWKDIDRRPDVRINNDGVYDAMLKSVTASTATGTIWNSWETNWTGKQTHKENMRGSTGFNSITSDKGQNRTGIQTTIGTDTIIESVGDRVVEINFAPFMRSRFISFEGTRLRPDTQVYAFFDGVDVSDWVNMVDLDNLDATFTAMKQNAEVTGINGEAGNPLGGAGTLTTEANGSIKGSFFIPNNEALNFSTGNKTLILTSSSTNSQTGDNTTSATANYIAKGLIETVEAVSIATRVPVVQRRRLDESRVVNTTDRQWTVDYSDPLAQSFVVGIDGGAFITSLELYFETKDITEVPVQVQIREMENGVPTQRVVPFADKTLDSGDVNIPDTVTPNPSTVFTFDSPVYLQNGVEYCFVIMANSAEYRVKYAGMGEDDADGNRISKQPHNGVMFKSANASTWTPDQNKDITFKMNRAVFAPSATVYLENDIIQSRALREDAFQTVNASNDIIVSHSNHGMTTGETVSVSYDATTGTVGGIPDTEINKDHVIKNVTRDNYTITSDTTAANTDGIFGGKGIKASENLAWNILYPTIQEVTLPNTSTAWSIMGNTLIADNDYDVDTTWYPMIANTNTAHAYPQAVLAGSTKTLKFKGILSTESDNISPIIDLHRLSAITISNRINNPNSSITEEVSATAGTALAKYVTKAVQLEENSNNLDIYLDVNVPSGTDINVYYKTAVDATGFSGANWTSILPSDRNGNTIAISTPINIDDFKEYSYKVTGSSFTLFAVKIVFLSGSSSNIPTCKRLRAIASLDV